MIKFKLKQCPKDSKVLCDPRISCIDCRTVAEDVTKENHPYDNSTTFTFNGTDQLKVFRNTIDDLNIHEYNQFFKTMEGWTHT